MTLRTAGWLTAGTAALSAGLLAWGRNTWRKS